MVLTANSDIDYFLVLNTDNMSWEKGKSVGVPPLNRYGHTSTSIGPHILIFGMKKNNFFLISLKEDGSSAEQRMNLS